MARQEKKSLKSLLSSRSEMCMSAIGTTIAFCTIAPGNDRQLRQQQKGAKAMHEKLWQSSIAKLTGPLPRGNQWTTLCNFKCHISSRFWCCSATFIRSTDISCQYWLDILSCKRSHASSTNCLKHIQVASMFLPLGEAQNTETTQSSLTIHHYCLTAAIINVGTHGTCLVRIEHLRSTMI